MTERIIRQNELSEMLGVSRQTLWEWERQGKLPPRFKLVENGRAAGWLRSTINEWLEKRKNTARQIEETEK